MTLENCLIRCLLLWSEWFAPCPSPRPTQAGQSILRPAQEVLQPDPPYPLLPPQIYDHAAHRGGAERLHINSNLRLNQRLVCRVEVDPHGAEPAPAACWSDHPVAHATDERFPRDPVAACLQPV